MNIRAGLGEYILQTHSTTFFEDSMGGLNRPNPPLGTPVSVTMFYLSYCPSFTLISQIVPMNMNERSTLSSGCSAWKFFVV